MNAAILCVGKLKEKWQREGVNEYLKRLSRYGKYEIVQVEDGRITFRGASGAASGLPSSPSRPEFISI